MLITEREQERPSLARKGKNMYTEAKFEIIGRVGQVKVLDGVAKLSVAVDRNYKDDNGD